MVLLVAGAFVALLVAVRLVAAALGSGFSPFDRLPADHGVRGFWLLVAAVALAALVWLVARFGEPVLWLQTPGGALSLPAAALEERAARAAEADDEVVRAEAEVRASRGALVADVRVFGRPFGDAGRLGDDAAGRVRAELASITGLDDVRVRVRPRVLAVRQLARYLP